jgi:hypothetical protein
MNRLSKKNYDTLDENFLYKKKPIIDNSFSVGTTSGTYHCQNWTFKVKKKDGEAWMIDTYWGSSYGSGHKVTNKNMKEYKKIFDFREVRRIMDNEVDEYNQKDLFFVATDSGGYSCGHLYWVKKTAEKSNEKLIKKKKTEIESYKRKIDWAEQDLRDLIKEVKSK